MRRPGRDAPKTCALATAPTLMASGAVAGDPAVPRPKKSRSFPGRDDRHDTGAHDVPDRFDEDVRPGVRLRAAAREVDDVHAVLHGRLERGDDLRAVGGAAAAQRRRRGDVEHPVVPDVRTWRDALDPLDRRMTAAVRLAAEARLARLDVRLDAGDHTGDERPMEGVVAVERCAVRAGTREAAGGDHLGCRRSARPLGESRRIREAGRIEERVLVIDPVVDDRDLDPVSAGARERRELRSAENGWASVQVQVVRVARIHLRRDPRVEELRQPGVRHAHREAVHEHLVAARHERVRHRIVQIGDSPRLLRLERAQVRARERAPHVQLLPDTEASEPAGVRRGRERRIIELHDHAHAVAAGGTSNREVRSRPDCQQRLFDDALRRSIDRTGRRAGDGDDCDE